MISLKKTPVKSLLFEDVISKKKYLQQKHSETLIPKNTHLSYEIS